MLSKDNRFFPPCCRAKYRIYNSGESPNGLTKHRERRPYREYDSIFLITLARCSLLLSFYIFVKKFV